MRGVFHVKVPSASLCLGRQTHQLFLGELLHVTVLIHYLESVHLVKVGDLTLEDAVP